MNSTRSEPATGQTNKGLGKSFKPNHGPCQ